MTITGATSVWVPWTRERSRLYGDEYETNNLLLADVEIDADVRFDISGEPYIVNSTVYELTPSGPQILTEDEIMENNSIYTIDDAIYASLKEAYDE